MAYAKKSLGQHFLTSEGAVDSIVDAGDVTGDDVVLEVGPGKGVLTKKLLYFAGKVIAVEKDAQLVELLKEKFKKEIKNNKLDLVEKDILDFDLGLLEFYKKELGQYKLIANIPYNITGILIRKFLESKNQPERMVLMLQKEVAERIVAKDKKESILSISVKVYGEPKYIRMVRAGSFSPAPKVDSAILLIQNISKDFFKTFSEEKFFEILRAGFKSKRKKLSSNLSEVIEKKKVLDAFKKLNLDPNLRAEDLDVEGWRKLSETLLS
jgi:16S rRNA (adenine1518-N6/adenine1519-N6)-dimethyltransferase